MKLFHLSGDISDLSEISFKPRVPLFRAKGENDTIPRVCFSDSILGCLRAIPECDECGLGYKMTKKLNFNTPVLYDVYMLDTSCLGDKEILNPNQLKRLEYVPDANNNNEYWILSEITCSKIFRINITDVIVDEQGNEEILYEKLFT
ncbi:hypothetical protein C4D27_16315 [Clostridium perfringens]|uniref:hypothetical protein n=1 Tax=Clostridium perfringens TaxID=1502 RepID=UPI0039E8D314